MKACSSGGMKVLITEWRLAYDDWNSYPATGIGCGRHHTGNSKSAKRDQIKKSLHHVSCAVMVNCAGSFLLYWNINLFC